METTRNESKPALKVTCVVLLLLIASLTLVTVKPVAAQAATYAVHPNPGPTCGWHGSLNGSGVVSISPAGSLVMITIGEPSWEQACYSFPGLDGSTSGFSFPAYEVFPITIQTSANVTIRLKAGEADPSAQQIAQGVRNTTIWTWFSPDSVTTNSNGVAISNLTLVGAVMPFVPNDISNISLPIIAITSTGVNGSIGLPIEFAGGNSGVLILNSPGPISFGAGIGGQAGLPSHPLFATVYSPNSSSTPLQVSLKVLGTYNNGKVGPLPPEVQLSFPRSTFELNPDSVLYIEVSENNSLKPSSSSLSSTYTFAVQEIVGNSTYVEPLTVSVSLMEMSFGSSPSMAPLHAPRTNSLGILSAFWGNSTLTLIAIAAISLLGLAVAVMVIRRKKSEQREDEPHLLATH